jgi:hypothetical protein
LIQGFDPAEDNGEGTSFDRLTGSTWELDWTQRMNLSRLYLGSSLKEKVVPSRRYYPFKVEALY